MKILVGILAAVAAVLLLLLMQAQGDNSKLRARLADTSDKNLAAAKLACAERAASVFRTLGYAENGDGGKNGLDSDTFTDHYNPTLKRCVMVLETSSVDFRDGARQTIIRFVFDADERKDFGDYAWVSSDTKRMEDQAPIRCEMKPPGKPEQRCHSTAEWDAYVKTLME